MISPLFSNQTTLSCQQYTGAMPHHTVYSVRAANRSLIHNQTETRGQVELS